MNSIRSSRLPKAVAVVGAVLVAATISTTGPSNAATTTTSTNIVKNGRFSSAPLPGECALHFTLFNNSVADTTCNRVKPSTAPSGGLWMMHVTSTGGGNGLVQLMKPFNTGPKKAHVSAWVYTVSGAVTIGIGNGGATGQDVVSTTIGVWEHLQATVGGTAGPINELVIYTHAAAAEFYVDNVVVTPVP